MPFDLAGLVWFWLCGSGVFASNQNGITNEKQSPAEYKKQLALLQKMVKDWPFFRTLLSNIDMVLAKSDLALASRYAELVTDAALRKKIFNRIETEWHLTVTALQLIIGTNSA